MSLVETLQHFKIELENSAAGRLTEDVGTAKCSLAQFDATARFTVAQVRTVRAQTASRLERALQATSVRSSSRVFRESKRNTCISGGELNPLQRVATTTDELANVAQRLSRGQKQKEFPDLPVSDPVA